MDETRGTSASQTTRRQYLSILFSDLSDSTRLAELMEVEHYAEILNDLRRVCREIIPQHGGRIAQLLGDGVLAIFGYPQAAEDDGRRATEAALALHAAVAALRPRAGDLPIALGMHTGIHAGLVLLGEGDPELGAFQLLGNVLNIAARLSDAAERDEILVSTGTLGPARVFFHTSKPMSVSLKGAAEPIAVYRVLGRAPGGTRFEAGNRRDLVPFVGRRRELQLVEQELAAVLEGQSRYVALCASPGMGKTRLAEEFLARAATLNCRVCRGYCESHLGAEPLQPFLQMLRSLFGLEHGVSPAGAAAAFSDRVEKIDPALMAYRSDLLSALSLDEGKRPDPAQVVTALRELFATLASKQPLVLFIDDWQWADGATRQVFRALRDLDGRSILLLIATRTFAGGDADVSGAREVELAPFTNDEAAEAVCRLLPQADPFVVDEIHQYSGGNPLFIEELCHSAGHEEIGHRVARVHGSVAWLDTLIDARLARLPDAHASLVRAAAVIGNVIPVWLLESISGTAAGDPRFNELAQQDFIFQGETPGTLRFKHGITRDAVYKAIGLHQRRAMHLQIATSLREHGDAGSAHERYEPLAYHYSASGQTAEAAYYAELAGDKAMAASALDRAQAHYRAALDALDQLPLSEHTSARWIKVAQRYGQACVFDPSRESLPILRRAVERATASNNLESIANAEYWLGYLNYGLGESRATIRHCERALAAAPASMRDKSSWVQIRAMLGQALAAACDYDRATELLDEAIAIKRRHRTGARPAVGLSYTLTCKASVLGDRGEFGLAHECFNEAIEAVRGANHEVEGSLFSWQSAVYLWQGRWDDARRCAVLAQNVAGRVRSLYLFAMARAVAAYADWATVQNPQSLQTILDSTAWLEARDRGQYISLNYGWLAEALVGSGRVSEARGQAARALVRARKNDLLGQSMAARAMARSAAQGRNRKSAEHYLALAFDAAHARQSRHEIATTRLCAAQIAASRGDRATAAQLIDEAAREFSAMQMQWHLDRAMQLRATL